MAAKSTSKRGSPGSKTNAIIWGILAALVLAAGVLALNVTQRARRVAAEANQIRKVIQDAVRRQEMVVKAPARREFSPAFLQMAFGDNPPLLQEIEEALGEALGQNPSLVQGEVAMMIVTYRAEGELRDVAIHVFGNLVPTETPAFSTEGYWKTYVPEQFYQLGQSSLSLLGREVLVLAEPTVEVRQREILDAALNNRYDVFKDYFHDPVSFIAVVPEPGLILTEQYSPYMAAMLVKGKMSMKEGRAELVALSYEPERAEELAQLVSDVRHMMTAFARIRFMSKKADVAMTEFARSYVGVQGPTVIARMMMPQDVIEISLPRLVRVLSKGIGRIHRGPDYPT